MRALFVAIALALLASAASAQSIGVVKTVQGDVQLHRGDDQRALAVGDDLLARDVIRTSLDSAFAAALSDGSRVSLGENSSLALEKVLFEPAEGLFDLFLKVLSGRFVYSSGRIGAQAPEKVRIETPYLTIGTRGTRVAVIVPESAPEAKP